MIEKDNKNKLSYAQYNTIISNIIYDITKIENYIDCFGKDMTLSEIIDKLEEKRIKYTKLRDEQLFNMNNNDNI